MEECNFPYSRYFEVMPFDQALEKSIFSALLSINRSINIRALDAKRDFTFFGHLVEFAWNHHRSITKEEARRISLESFRMGQIDITQLITKFNPIP